MNSINNIAKAMEYEFERQVDLIENGGSVVQKLSVMMTQPTQHLQ